MIYTKPVGRNGVLAFNKTLSRIFIFLSIFTFSFSDLPSPQTPAPGVTAELRFSEGSGTTAADGSGNGHTGTLTSGATWTTGQYGQGVSLNGSSNYVDVADHANFTLDPAQSYTWSTWVRNTNFNEWGTVWSQTVDVSNYFYFYTHTTADPDGGPVTNGVSVYWWSNNGAGRLGVHSNDNVLTAGGWSYVAITYDASQAQTNRFTIYVNGADVTNRSDISSSGTLLTIDPTNIRMGSNQAFGEYLNGAVDEARYYRRLLSQAEIQADMLIGDAPDTESPTISLTAPVAGNVSGIVNVTANAGDNVGVAGVQFLLDGSNLGAEDITVPYSFSWITTSVSNGNHTLTARARDAAGNTTTSTEVIVNVNNITDNIAPTVSLTGPAAGTISGTINVDATASDNMGVAGVQFLLDGNNLGAEDTQAPYSVSWATTGASNGNHTLTARARDAAGNTTTSSSVAVVVNNVVSNTNLVASYGFNENTGTTLNDNSGQNNHGILANGPAWTAAGKYGPALSFDGTNDLVNINDANTLDLTNGMTLEAWVNPNNLTGYKTVLCKENGTNNFIYTLSANNNTTTVANQRPNSRMANGTATVTVTGTTKLPLNTWTHIASTYDGAVLRFYVNGVQVAVTNINGSMGVGTGMLRIGGTTTLGSQYFAGLIDEVRVYNRALTAAEIQTDMNTPIETPAPDVTAPVINLTAPAAGTVAGTINVTANASDNVGVAGVQFLLDGNNLGVEDITSPYSVSWNTATATNGNHTLTARARDAAGNTTTSTEVIVNVNNITDNIAPTVSLTAPVAGTVSGTINVDATASDNIGVAGVQFLLDGNNLGVEDITSPYSVSWNTATATNGNHTLTARARDAAGNTTTSSSVAVVVNNVVVNTNLVASYGFNENTGTALTDNSGRNNHGTLANGPVWTAAGKYGSALLFDGTNDLVNINDANTLDLTNGMTIEAWVNPNNLTGYKTVLCKENGTNNFIYTLSANNNTTTVANQRPNSRMANGTATVTVTGATKLGLNTWTHIASTYDGAVFRFYVNGVQVAVTNINGSMGVSTGMLRIGGTTTLGSQYFGGLIDEVRIYNRALTATEIQTDMNTPIAPDDTAPTVSVTSPVAASTVSGTIDMTATAADNYGVAGVQFLLDGTELGTEDLAAPYTVSWNTQLVSNGNHILTARARDAAGNTTISAPVSVTVGPDYSFTVLTPNRNVETSGTTDFRIYVAYLNGYTTNQMQLAVSGLPPNTSSHFLFNPMSHQGETQLIVTTSGAALGSYPLVLSTTSTEGVVKTQQATLNITAAADFSLTAAPSIQNVTAGNSTTYTINLNETNDFVSPVTLSVPGLPAGITASFNPASATPVATSTLTLTTLASTAPGTYNLTVQGMSGAVTRTVPITLSVTTAASVWTVSNIGSTGVANNTVRVGALKADGLERVYIGTIGTGRMLEYTWGGTAWTGPVDVGGSPAGLEIHDCNIGPGRGDGKDRLYAASYDFNIYELWHDATGWHQMTVGSLDGNLAMHMDIGIGRNDGVTRLYAASTQFLYEFTWNGTSWTKQLIGATPGAHAVEVGNGRNDGNNYIYVASISSGNFEARWTGSAWVIASMGDNGDSRGIGMGAGKNDGVNRVYAAMYDGTMREFTWSGTAWTFVNMPSSGTQNVHAYVATGRNDGVNRIYTDNGNGKVLEYSWNGSTWTVYNMGGGSDYMYGLHYGIGRNDGLIRLYSTDRGSVNRVYEFTWTAPPPIVMLGPYQPYRREEIISNINLPSSFSDADEEK